MDNTESVAIRKGYDTSPFHIAKPETGRNETGEGTGFPSPLTAFIAGAKMKRTVFPVEG